MRHKAGSTPGQHRTTWRVSDPPLLRELAGFSTLRLAARSVEGATAPRSTLTGRYTTWPSRLQVGSADHLSATANSTAFVGTLLIMPSHRRLAVVVGAHVGGLPTNLLSEAPVGCPPARAGRGSHRV